MKSIFGIAGVRGRHRCRRRNPSFITGVLHAGFAPLEAMSARFAPLEIRAAPDGTFAAYPSLLKEGVTALTPEVLMLMRSETWRGREP